MEEVDMSQSRLVMFLMLFLGLTLSPLFLVVAAVMFLAPSEPKLIPRDDEGRRCCPVCHSRHYLIFPTRQKSYFGHSWISAFCRNQMEYRYQDCTMSWKESGDG
jgi:hypothetical protein